MKSILLLVSLFFACDSIAQQTINKLNVNELKLPKEASGKILSTDGSKNVKATGADVSWVEDPANVVHTSGDEIISGIKTLTGKLVTSSTTNGSVPCPSMTKAQRDLIAIPSNGECILNTDKGTLNVFDGTAWKSAGGGLSPWVTATAYAIGDIVIDSDKIYKALEDHTSGTFATDLVANKWLRLNDEFSVNTKKGTLLTVPNEQATKVDDDTILLETGNDNLLANASFEAPLTGGTSPSWTTPNAVLVQSNHAMVGANALGLTYTANPVNIYQDSTLNTIGYVADIDGIRSIWIKSFIADTDTLALYVCARKAGVTIATSNGTEITDCVKVIGNGVYREYKYPSMIGATSNGIAVVSLNPKTGLAANVTGSLLIDGAKVAVGNQAQIYTPPARVQGSIINQPGTTYASEAAIKGSITYPLGNANDLYSYNSVSGLFTILKKSQVTISVSIKKTGTGDSQPAISVNGGDISIDSASKAGIWSSTSVTIPLNEGGYFFARGASGTFESPKLTVSATEIVESSTSYLADSVDDTGKISSILFNSNTVAPKGYISAMNKSIGSDASSADYKGADYKKLYDILWAQAGLSVTAGHTYVISSAKGASAQADWDANKKITIDYSTNSPFIRAAGVGQTLGAFQDDAFQGHFHQNSSSRIGNSGGTGEFLGTSDTPGSETRTGRIKNPVTDGSNGSPRIANETRPKNTALNAWICFKAINIMVAEIDAKNIKYEDEFHTDERMTNRIWRGSAVHRRCLERTAEAALGTTIATFATGLTPINAWRNHNSGNYYFGGAISAASSSSINYNPATGDIKTSKDASGTSNSFAWCMEYTK